MHVSEGDLLVARGLARRRGVGELLRGAAGNVLLVVGLAGVARGRVRQGDVAAEWVTGTGGTGTRDVTATSASRAVRFGRVTRPRSGHGARWRGKKIWRSFNVSRKKKKKEKLNLCAGKVETLSEDV